MATSAASAATPAFQIQECGPEDMETCMSILSASFTGGAPFIDVYFPDHSTAAGQARGAERLRAMVTEEDGGGKSPTTILKAVETTAAAPTAPAVDGSTSASSTGPTNPPPSARILGFAIWTHLTATHNAPADLFAAPGKRSALVSAWSSPHSVSGNLSHLGSPDNAVRLMSQLWRAYAGPRRAAAEEGGEAGAMALEVLAVRPDAQRRGIGAALIRWGTEAADESGVAAVVEATEKGRAPYERAGFVSGGRIDFESVVDEDLKRLHKMPELVFMRRDPAC